MMIGAADAAAPDGESSDATTPASAAAASNTISFLIGFVDSFHSSFSLPSLYPRHRTLPSVTQSLCYFGARALNRLMTNTAIR